MQHWKYIYYYVYIKFISIYVLFIAVNVVTITQLLQLILFLSHSLTCYYYYYWKVHSLLLVIEHDSTYEHPKQQHQQQYDDNNVCPHVTLSAWEKLFWAHLISRSHKYSRYMCTENVQFVVLRKINFRFWLQTQI